MGPLGPSGEDGPPGVSIQSVEMIGGELFVTFDNGFVQSAGSIDIPNQSTILDPSQYTFSYNDTFGQLELEVVDVSILNAYIRLGISVRVYDIAGAVSYTSNFTSLYAGDPNNMGGLSLSIISGETYDVEISFMTELGLMIINETFVAP
jgi:hypothetical protein